MAMIDTAQKAPFGAVTIHRVTAGLSSLGQTIREYNARRETEARLLELSPTQLEDIGLSQADFVERSTLIGRIYDWMRDRWEVAETARMLSSLDARQLDDIGLTEGDVLRYRQASGLL